MAEGQQRWIASRYRLIRSLGEGGMGTVWEAWDEQLRSRVAVKQMRLPEYLTPGQRAERIERARREAANTAQLRNHPGVVTIYDIAEDAGEPWIVMELLEARSLEDLVRARVPMELGRAVTLGVALLDALGAAHRVGIVHRDVKPSNVLITRDGRMVLTDFGIAVHDGDRGLTGADIVIGSPGYMAPEQALGQAPTAASDLFSLGATLYFAVEGHGPFERQTTAAMLAAVLNDPPLPAQRLGHLAPLITRLLEKDPRVRPAIEQAQLYLAGPTGSGVPMPPQGPQPDLIATVMDGRRPEPPVPLAPRIRRRWPWVVLTAAVAATAVTVSAVLLANTGGGSAHAQGATSSAPAAPPASGPPPTYTIGYVGDLTGDQGPSGTEEAAAVKLAVQQANARNLGFRLTTTEYDSRSDLSPGGGRATALQAAVKDTSTLAVVGGSPDQAADALNTANLPDVTPLGKDTCATGQAKSAFCLGPSVQQSWTQVADYLAKVKGFLGVAIVDDGSSTMKTAGQTLTTALTADAVPVVHEYTANESDQYASAAQQVATDLPEAVIELGVDAGTLSDALRTATWSGYTAQVWVGLDNLAGFDGTDIIDPTLEPGPPSAPSSLEPFTSAYQQSTGRTPAEYTPTYYDAANAIIDAITRAHDHGGTVTRQTITDALRTTHYTGVTGTVTFDSNGQQQGGAWYLYSDDQNGTVTYRGPLPQLIAGH